MDPTFYAGKLFGIRIGLSASWFLFFAFITWSLSAFYFPSEHPGWPALVYWIMGIAASVLFFLSVLAHELAHSVVALRYSLPVSRITLFFFGGVAQITREAATPKIDAAVSIAGPLGSLGAALLFGLIYLGARGTLPPLAALGLWLAMINGSLVLFNLVPGLPLDGGRLLRALIWFVTEDYRLATRLASGAGQLLGLMLVFYGLYAASVSTGGLLEGVWPVMVGWFLRSAALGSYRSLKAMDRLKEITVRDAMVRDVAAVRADAMLTEISLLGVKGQRLGSLPVLEGDRLLGTVSSREARRVPRDRRGVTQVTQLLRPVDQYPPLEAIERGDRALEQMNALDVDDLPVVEDGRLVGMISRYDLVRMLPKLGLRS